MNSFEPHFVLPTTEVRWFHEGEIPSSWLPWFEGFPGPGQDEPPRTDSYLIIRDTDSLGIKIRQGRLEIKQRLESWDVLKLNDHVRGLVEHWIKWSYEIVESNDLPAELDQAESNWINVHKLRKLRRYQLGREGQLVSLPESVYPPDLCEVELTNVWIGQQPWWSLAFEAPGAKQSSHKVLTTISRQLFGLEGTPKLLASNSYGYPRWLASLKW